MPAAATVYSVSCAGSAELIAVSSLFTYDIYRCAPDPCPSLLTDLRTQCTCPAAPALSAQKPDVGAVIRCRTYIKPNCSPKETILVSRICVVAFGCLMGILAVLLNVAGVSLGWVRRIQLSAVPPPQHVSTQMSCAWQASSGLRRCRLGVSI